MIGYGAVLRPNSSVADHLPFSIHLASYENKKIFLLELTERLLIMRGSSRKTFLDVPLTTPVIAIAALY